MVARLGMFLCLTLLYWLPSVVTTQGLRAKTKHPKWNVPFRVFGTFMLLLMGAFPLAGAIFVGPVMLFGKAERTIALCAGVVCLVVTAGALWRNLRAPQIEHEEFKRIQKAKRWKLLGAHFGVMLAILGCGAIFWLRGRQAGLRALDKAAAEAQAIIASRQEGASPEAAREYNVLFDEMIDDKELATAQEKTRNKVPKWPEGEELAKLVAGRRVRLDHLVRLSAGPAPVPALKVWLSGGSLSLGKTDDGLRIAGFLLDLAGREAAARGDGPAVMLALQTRLRLGAHLRVLPTTLGVLRARSTALPGPNTLGLALPALAAGHRAELSAHIQALRTMRQAVPEQVSRAAVEDAASYLLWMQHMESNPKDVAEDLRPIASANAWFFLPLYGEAFSKSALPLARTQAELLRLPFDRARVEVEALEAKPPRLPDLLGLSLWGWSPSSRCLVHRANGEQRIGACEAACALRLHALDNGKYPATLAELTPRYMASELLDPQGPVRLTYKPEGPGFRLTWKYWRQTSPGFEPADDTYEIAVGVPPTPPEKLKKR